jgi:hypothetical protein
VNVVVTLCGHAAEWRFPGSSGARGWLASRPWSGSGGVRVLTLPVRSDVADFETSVRSAVRAHDDGLSGVRVEHLRPESLANGPLGVLNQTLGLPSGGSRRSQLEAIGSALVASYPLFLTISAGQATNAKFVDDAAELADQVAKVQPGAVVTALILDTAQPRIGGESFDYGAGEPQEAILPIMAVSMDTGWRAYLHLRAAWEAAGQPGLASQFEQSLNTGALSTPGDDNRTELALNKVAHELWDGVDAPSRVALTAYLGSMTSRTADGNADAEASLLAEGLLWKPLGSAAAIPVPWVSRGLLLRTVNPPAALLLRSSTICSLLARELLIRCFDLEVRARAELSASLVSIPPDPECESRLSDFRSGVARFEVALYPNGCPAAPSDAWAFATFGEYLRGAGVLSDNRDPRTRLRLLRNAIAHGHYVGWRAVMEAFAIESHFAHR